MKTVRLTMAQALVRYLITQKTIIDREEVPLFAGVFAIFGHGNVTCLGEALEPVQNVLPNHARPRRLRPGLHRPCPGHPGRGLRLSRRVLRADRSSRARPRPDADQIREAAKLICHTKKPLIIAGGGVHYSFADAWWDVDVRVVSERKEVRAVKADISADEARQRIGV